MALVPGMTQEEEAMANSFAEADLASLFPMGDMHHDLMPMDSQRKPCKRAKLTVPRWSISRTHLRQLEEIFKTVKAPSLALRQSLAEQMGVNPRQVQVWFRNRRQRVRLVRIATETEGEDPPPDVAAFAAGRSVATRPQQPGLPTPLMPSPPFPQPVAMSAHPSSAVGLLPIGIASPMADDTFSQMDAATEDTMSLVMPLSPSRCEMARQTRKAEMPAQREMMPSTNAADASAASQKAQQPSVHSLPTVSALGHLAPVPPMVAPQPDMQGDSSRRSLATLPLSSATPLSHPNHTAFQPRETFALRDMVEAERAAAAEQSRSGMQSLVDGFDLSGFDLSGGAAAIAAAISAAMPPPAPIAMSAAQQQQAKELAATQQQARELVAVQQAREQAAAQQQAFVPDLMPMMTSGGADATRGMRLAGGEASQRYPEDNKSWLSTVEATPLERPVYKLPPAQEMHTRLMHAHNLQMQMQWQLQVQSRVLNSMMMGGALGGGGIVGDSSLAGGGGDGGAAAAMGGFGINRAGLFGVSPAVPQSAPSVSLAMDAWSGAPRSTALPMGNACAPPPAPAPAPAPAAVWSLPQQHPPSRVSIPSPTPAGRPDLSPIIAPFVSRSVDEESLAETLSIDDLIGGLAY